MAKKPTKPTSKGQQIVVKTKPPSGAAALPGNGSIYVGVASGSDLEKYGYQVRVLHPADPAATTGPASFARDSILNKKPKYKTGYQNSRQFAREMNLQGLAQVDPNVLYGYQQRMQAAGLLDNYAPGQLDKSTRAAFKELLTRANQTASTWSEALQDIETTGTVAADGSNGSGAAQQQVVLDDPVSLRQAFQKVAQTIYGGDLPDQEVNQMVDAYRSAQLAKSQDTSAVTDSLPDAGTFAEQQLKDTHPQQLARVKFQDSLGTMLSTLGSSVGGQ